MPLFSIVIPVYNMEEYLSACLDSLKAQDLQDWEAVVVIDASPDGCAAIAKSYAENDSRYVVIEKSKNEGLHRARAAGVEAANGRYITFLDPDDELAEGTFSSLQAVLPSADDVILHFGLRCVGDAVDENTANSFEGWANTSLPALDRAGLLNAVFSTNGEYGKDWNVHHRVFGAELAKKAFSKMTSGDLRRAEDAYELFCLACFSNGEVTHDEIGGYLYHIGRGVTNSNELSLERYVQETTQLIECANAAIAFANSLSDEAPIKASVALYGRLAFSAANEWHDRVVEEDKMAALQEYAHIVDDRYAAVEIMRFARDEAYGALQNGEVYSDDALYAKLFSMAQELVLHVGNALPKFYAYVETAKAHIVDLRFRAKLADWKNQSIRIFVSAHKPVDLFESNILQPVEVGAASREYSFPWAWQDDAGENISSQNPMYCELTAQYWAWKNVDAEYYGFCHYRRYFNFSDKRFEENPWGEIMEPLIDDASQKKFGLDDESIRAAVEGYDIVTTEVKDLTEFPEGFSTPLAQYEAAPKLNIEDLYGVFSIVEDMYPEYSEDIQSFANGHESCFCNMFIMKKQIFMEYSEWLFSILQRFVSKWDSSLYSKEGLRTPGHLAERLLNIYLMHGERVGAGWKRKQVQCVHFEFPDKRNYSLPLFNGFDKNDKPIIPVVFAADNNYVPMLTTTISSMLENASKDYFYDVVVIEDGISGENKRIMQEFLSVHANATLRFFGAGALISGYELTTSNEHISKETYYRFLIQDILPYYNKVLYLDSDLIIEGDVAELYNTELGSNLLAAAHDIDYMGNLNMPDGQRMEYTKEVLEMDDPYSYFQAGVLVFNTAEMRKLHTVGEWMEIASNPNYIYNDQDILNANCEGRVTYLDYGWNVMHDCGGRVASVFSFAPAAAFDAYSASRANPKIIHYAGFEKPWAVPECDYAEHYWVYARKSPFYEKLISFIAKYQAKELREELGRRIDFIQWEIDTPAKAVGENNPIRKVVDPIMPMGSRRREIAKSVGRRLRGRS